MKFHHLSEAYPLMPEEELQALTESMKERGFDRRFPIVVYKKLILDGRNRWLAAKGAKIKPRFIAFKGSDAQAKAFVATANEHRRHLSEAWREQNRKERLNRIADAHKAGKSQRDIADDEGVSQPQIHRDLQKLGLLEIPDVVFDTPRIKNNVEGNFDSAAADLKSPSDSQILCERCARVGAIPGCRLCAEANQPARGAKRKEPKADKPTRAKPKKDALLDHFGNEIPDRCRDAWSDPWLPRTYDFLTTWAEAFRTERLSTGYSKRKKHYAGFSQGAEDFIAGVTMIDNTLDQLVEFLKTNRPAGVCPPCAGKGCSECEMRGLVSRERYAKLGKKK